MKTAIGITVVGVVFSFVFFVSPVLADEKLCCNDIYAEAEETVAVDTSEYEELNDVLPCCEIVARTGCCPNYSEQNSFGDELNTGLTDIQYDVQLNYENIPSFIFKPPEV